MESSETNFPRTLQEMALFKTLFFLAAIAVSASAASVLPRAGCDNPVVETDWVDVNGNLVKFETAHCPSALVARTDTLRVCGASCTNVCNSDAGTLPPIVEDCQMIKNAITIFTNHSPPSFVVSPGGNKTLSFKTCSFSFVNIASSDLEYCYTDFSATASRAGSACFPPVMPVRSEGLCTSSDKSWTVIAAHAPGFS